MRHRHREVPGREDRRHHRGLQGREDGGSLSLIVAVALFELHIEYAESLKDKRMVVRSVRDKLRRRFKVAVNEVAFHDLHQRARLAVALIADRNDSADSLLDTIQRFVETNTDAVLTGWTQEKLDFDEEADLT